MPSNTHSRTALVFGASGITGWALLREALSYPSSNTFDRVIGLSNRPLDRVKAILPDDERLNLAHGVDLTASVDDVVEKLSLIEGIKDVTDVYFAAYVQPPGASDFEGFEILKEANVNLLKTAVLAVERVSPKLRFWTLQTGGKAYGFVHVRQVGLPKVPAAETDPRVQQPYEDQIFYYAQYDVLKELSSGKNWRFADIRPDLVIGFVPGGGNAMNYAQALALFLSFYADREAATAGNKKSIPYPGPLAAYQAHYTETGQTTLARAHIFASSQDEAANGEIYNVGDSPSPTGTNWADKWSALCKYFGLEGVAPEDGASQTLSAAGYMTQHQDEWEAFEKKNGLVPGIIGKTSWEFMEVITSMVVFDRQYDLSKVISAGFNKQQPILENYEEAFSLMKKAKIIP